MAFVLDASITACWAFQDEEHTHADLAFARIRTEEAAVPCLWWFEVRNILIVNERRRRIGEPETAAFLRDLSRLRIRTDRGPQQREGLPLATLDNSLGVAARTEGADWLEKPGKKLAGYLV
jgi:hypothetical protein